METKLQSLANKSFVNVLLDGFKLFEKCYLKLILPFLLFQIISIVVQVGLLTDLLLLSYKQTNDITLIFLFYLTLSLQFLIRMVFSILVMCLVSKFVYKTYIGVETRLFEECKKAFNSKLILVILILGVCMGLGFSPSVLFIPGIIIFGFYIFLIFTYNSENTKKNFVSETKSISKGSFWNTIFIATIFIITLFFIDLVYRTYLFNILFLEAFNNQIYFRWLINRNYLMLIIYEIITNLPSMFLAPLFICLLTPLFSRCKARYELGSKYNSTKEQPYAREALIQEPNSSKQNSATQKSPWELKIQQSKNQ